MGKARKEQRAGTRAFSTRSSILTLRHREVTGECIRDKIALAKRKGSWEGTTGGFAHKLSLLPINPFGKRHRSDRQRTDNPVRLWSQAAMSLPLEMPVTLPEIIERVELLKEEMTIVQRSLEKIAGETTPPPQSGGKD